MVTLKEIAEECGVSTATVSNILNGKNKANEETKKKVLEVIERTGYSINTTARGLRKQKTDVIGIIAEDIAQFTTPLIVEGIMSYFEQHGYRTVVKNLRLYARWLDTWYNNDAAYHSILDPVLREMNSSTVDGIIYIAGHARKISSFPEGYSLPAVMTYAYSMEKSVPSVVIDDENGAYAAMKHVIAHGHTNIGIIAGDEGNIHTQKRIRGVQRAMFEAGIPYNPANTKFEGWEKEDGYRGASKLLTGDHGITAVFCTADRIAGGLYQYLHEKGLTPGKDIAVMGFDDQDIAEFFVPGLTTMRLPLKEIGDKAAELLLSRIDGTYDAPEGSEYYILPKLVERESV